MATCVNCQGDDRMISAWHSDQLIVMDARYNGSVREILVLVPATASLVAEWEAEADLSHRSVGDVLSTAIKHYARHRQRTRAYQQKRKKRENKRKSA